MLFKENMLILIPNNSHGAGGGTTDDIDWRRCRAVNLLSSTLVFLQIIPAGLGLVFVRGKQLGQAKAVN